MSLWLLCSCYCFVTCVTDVTSLVSLQVSSEELAELTQIKAGLEEKLAQEMAARDKLEQQYM